jgi:hypothetical protein
MGKSRRLVTLPNAQAAATNYRICKWTAKIASASSNLKRWGARMNAETGLGPERASHPTTGHSGFRGDCHPQVTKELGLKETLAPGSDSRILFFLASV